MRPKPSGILWRQVSVSQMRLTRSTFWTAGSPSSRPNTRSKEPEFGIPPQVETDSGNVIEEIMEAKETKKQVVANDPADDVAEGHAHTSSITVDTQARLGRGPVTAVGVLAVVLALFIVLGIHGRSSAE